MVVGEARRMEKKTSFKKLLKKERYDGGSKSLVKAPTKEDEAEGEERREESARGKHQICVPVCV